MNNIKEKKVKYVKIGLLAVVSLIFQACVTGKHLSDNEILTKAIGGCPNPEMAIVMIPSRGAIADAMAITAIKTAGNDGGFSDSFSTYMKSNMKNVAVSCPNTQKLEAVLLNNFSLYKEDELKDVGICAIGMSDSKELLSEAHRTGASITFVP